MSKINTQELQNLLYGISQKEEEKFNQFYETYKGLMYGIAFSILKNKENAEDVVQVVCAKIWEMKPENFPTDKPASWLYTLTKNETLNFLRKQKKTINLEDIYEIGEEDSDLVGVIEKETYHKILAKLEKKDQEIVSLKIISGLSFRKIAQILDLPTGTVQWRYYKALNTLKTLLGNLSMFVLLFLAFILQKMQSIKNIEREEKPSQNVVEEQDVAESTSRDETKKEQGSVAPSPVVNEIIGNNETCENVIQETVNPTYSKNLEAGTLGLAGIFLVLTILFTGIFVKHQQNQKKHVSK